MEFARTFRERIRHVHWKDLPVKMEAQRGRTFGCGFSTIALGEGAIDISGVYEVLSEASVEYSTLEIAGDDNLRKSYECLKRLGAG